MLPPGLDHLTLRIHDSPSVSLDWMPWRKAFHRNTRGKTAMNGRNSRSCHWVEMRVSSMVLESGQSILVCRICQAIKRLRTVDTILPLKEIESTPRCRATLHGSHVVSIAGHSKGKDAMPLVNAGPNGIGHVLPPPYSSAFRNFRKPSRTTELTRKAEARGRPSMHAR
jgi:hypothetical protein